MAVTDRDRRALMILGAVAGVALVLFLLVFNKGGSEPGSTAAPGGGTPPAPVESPQPAPRTTPPPGSPVFGGRDPFQPLVDTGGGAAPSASPTTSPAPATSPSPTASPSPSPTESQTPGDTIEHDGHTLVLLGVVQEDGEDRAEVKVDGDKVYTPKVGQNFFDGFTLVGVHDACADFTHDTYAFTLCAGDNG